LHAIAFERETGMNEGSQERELSMDELDEVNGTGPTPPPAQYAERGAISLRWSDTASSTIRCSANCHALCSSFRGSPKG